MLIEPGGQLIDVNCNLFWLLVKEVFDEFEHRTTIPLRLIKIYVQDKTYL